MARPVAHTDGVLVVDKPAGWTSHDVVGKLRRIVGQRRIGHAGTLDPGATGVLVVALGAATKLMRFATELPKVYEGEIVLGTTTSTLDDEGEVTGTFAMDGVTLVDVRAAARAFVGEIQQVPPMVSALKVDGKRLHELAREGIEIERKARPVTIHSLSVTETDEPHVFRLAVSCSSGTYIRTLADDLGAALGGGAHLRRLRRTAIGPFTLDGAQTMEALEEEWQSHLMAPQAMVAHYPMVEVDEAVATSVRHGKPLDAALGPQGAAFVAVSLGERLLGIFARSDDQLRSVVTLPTNV